MQDRIGPTGRKEKLLTAEQLAERWQVKPSHVYRLTRVGQIPCVPLGRYYRYRLDLIEQFERGEWQPEVASIAEAA
jgi:excisionase family DNA binding protein